MNAQQLKNSILQLAVQGKLVPQDPNDEPASKLVERIRAEKEKLIKEKKIKPDKNPSYIFRGSDNLPYEKVGKNEPVCIADEVPFDIPDSWEWVRIQNLYSNGTGLSYKKDSLDDKTEKMIRVLRGGNILNDSYLFKPDDIFISDKYVKEDLYLKKNYLITPAVSSIENIGKIARIEKDYSNIVVGGFVLMLKPFFDNDILSTFMLYMFSSKIHRDNCRNITHKSGQAFYNLSREKLMQFLIPLPPLQEQQRIVDKLKELEAYINDYDKAYEKIEKLNTDFPDLLKKSILQEAVQGKLVPQDPTDEPASVLIEQIRQEKEQLIKDKKIKKDKNESYIFRRDNSHYEKIGTEERCIDDEIPFDIPDSWEWTRLKSICIVNPRNQAEDDIDAGFIPMTLINDGYTGGHMYEIKKWKQIKSGFTHFATGDLVLAKITPCFQNRKSTIISELPNNIGAGTTELHVIRNYPNSKLNLKYLLLLVKTADFISAGVKAFTGTAGQQRVGKTFVEEYLVPLPPLNEQQRIVDKVNQLLPQISKL